MPENKIAILTDSSCDLPGELLKECQIRVVPLRIVYEAEEYRDGVDITADQIFGRLPREVPKTSMPAPCDVTAAFDELSAQGYADAVFLTISSGLSGTYDMVRMVAKQYAGLRVEAVDTRTVSMGLGFLAVEAAREAARTGSVEAAVEKIGRIRPGMHAMFVIRTLEYLKRGGRIGKVESALGALLDIKPVISFEPDGICHTVAKARGFRNTVQRLTDTIRRRFEGKRINLAVMHAAALEEAQALLAEVRRFSTVCEAFVRQISPVLGVYSGAGLLGIVAYEVEV